MVLRLRRMAADLGDLACDGAATTPDRIAAARAVVSVQDQLMDLLSLPKRPASSPGNKRAQVLVDVSPSGPPDLDA
jgi:hypothetical protein